MPDEYEGKYYTSEGKESNGSSKNGKIKRFARAVGRGSSKILKKTGQFTEKKIEQFKESRKPEAQLARLQAEEKRLSIQKTIAAKRKSISKMRGSSGGFLSAFAPPKGDQGGFGSMPNIGGGGFGMGKMPNLGAGFGNAPRRKGKGKKQKFNPFMGF